MPVPVFQAPPCDKCDARCCTNKSPWNVVLVEPQEEERLTALGVEIVEVKFPEESGTPDGRGFFFDQKLGHCKFLDVNRRCMIYHDRPNTCRNFSCRPFEKHSEFLKMNPDVHALLREKRTDLNTGSTLVKKVEA